MIRKIAMGLLLLGAVSGYSHGFRSMRERHMAHRHAAMQQWAQTCADAAQHSSAHSPRGPIPPAEQPKRVF